MTDRLTRRHAVEQEIDVIIARQAAQRLARELGFTRIHCVEVAIVASELASNIVKYGVRGSVVVEAVDHPERGIGVRITAIDCGPPFNDFEMALRDGFDDKGPLDPFKLAKRRGLGTGLGAVKRLSDELGLEPAEGGKRVWAIRYAARPRRK